MICSVSLSQRLSPEFSLRHEWGTLGWTIFVITDIVLTCLTCFHHLPQIFCVCVLPKTQILNFSIGLLNSLNWISFLLPSQSCIYCSSNCCFILQTSTFPLSFLCQQCQDQKALICIPGLHPFQLSRSIQIPSCLEKPWFAIKFTALSTSSG